eukprot:4266456-Ditylum_brightwellii.AAC.1
MKIIRERGAAKVSFFLPEFMNNSMNTYLNELKKKTGCFIKNWNGRSKARSQNMGPNMLTEWPKVAANMCTLNPDDHTCTCW